MGRFRSHLATVPVLILLLTCAHGAPRGPVQSMDPAHADTTVPPQWQNDWSRGAVFYEVFVRSFRDSNGDGIGDLKGLISKLDYLNDGNAATNTDLGVDAIWLMPISKSPSYHGYDTTDYTNVNPEYGTNDDFALLCTEAHRRGIRVILDYVINHTGSDHPWFVDSASSPASSKRSWYQWSSSDPGWKQPWGGNYPTWHPKNGAYFYGVFWEGMPDLNFRTLAVRQMVKQTASLWFKRGADGFRLDAARYLIEDGAGPAQADTPETHNFWKEFSTHVRTVKPQATLVGECWADTGTIANYFGSMSIIAGGDELPMNFDFPLAEQIISGVNRGEATGIADKIADILLVYPPGANDAPFLTNHDNVRIATQLGRDPAKLRSSASILLTLPGAPFVYYGEEIGMQNGTTNNDEAKRTPMAWDNTAGGGFTTGTPWFPFAPGKTVSNAFSESQDPGSLFSRYRNLIRARRLSPAMTKGGIELLTQTIGSTPVLAFLRSTGTDRALVVHNLGNGFVVGGPYAFAATSIERIFADSGVGDPSGGTGAWRVVLPPHTSGIWRLR